MFFFGLEGSGFIISLALTLLISGAIMFYCLKRFNVLENSMIEQSKVLQSFIVRAQQGQSQFQPVHVATDVAIKSAKMQSNNSQYEESQIEVSDNEDADDEDDDDDSDSCATSDSENTSEQIVYNLDEKYQSVLQTEELPIIKLETTQFENPDDICTLETLSDKSTSVKVIAMQDIIPELLNLNQNNDSDSSNSSESNDDVPDNLINNELNIEELQLNTLENIKKQPVSKMRVGYLRQLVVERGDVENIDAANKLKKEQLLQMLQLNPSVN